MVDDDFTRHRYQRLDSAQYRALDFARMIEALLDHHFAIELEGLLDGRAQRGWLEHSAHPHRRAQIGWFDEDWEGEPAQLLEHDRALSLEAGLAQADVRQNR